MVVYNTILLHWKKFQKDFDKNLVQLQQRINKEAIHDIRVATKKLRALLDLYMLLKKEPEWKHLLIKTDNLFAVLGRYRDTEICLALTEVHEKDANCSYKELKHYLHLLLKTTQAWANQEIHRYHKNELAKIALLLKQDESLTDRNKFSHDLKAIIYHHLSETKKHFRQPHLVRKSLKDVYYWIPLLPDENTPDLWDQKGLHDILNDLGNWQDNEILDLRIKHFRKDFVPKTFEEYPLLKDFQNKIKNHKKTLLKAANSKARRWMKKVTENEKSEV